MTEITKRHIKDFKEQGYTILYKALSETELTLLHDEADMLSNYLMSEGYDILSDFGGIIEPLECGMLDPCPSQQYKSDLAAYYDRREQVTPGVARFLTTKAGYWAKSLLYGFTTNRQQVDTKTDLPIYLLNEQYIVKPPETASLSIFEWHRDSDYYKDGLHRQETSVACWIALDPVNEKNGTLLIGYLDGRAEQVKEIVNVPAGSIVFMSSDLLHKSVGNSSPRFRRVFMPQYAKRPFIDAQSSTPIALSIFLDPSYLI